jgi:protein phosphatase 1 regulatory subunit 11
MDGLAVRRQNTTHLNDEVVPTRTAVLHLRPAPTAAEVEQAERQRAMRVTWDPQVREPENQQVSKCCCVFHKKKLFGESSSDSSSSSSSDSDNEGGDGHPGSIPGAAAEAHTHDGCEHNPHSHRRRPKCTKDHCYCGTTFH